MRFVGPFTARAPSGVPSTMSGKAPTCRARKPSWTSTPMEGERNASTMTCRCGAAVESRFVDGLREGLGQEPTGLRDKRFKAEN